MGSPLTHRSTDVGSVRPIPLQKRKRWLAGVPRDRRRHRPNPNPSSTRPLPAMRTRPSRDLDERRACARVRGRRRCCPAGARARRVLGSVLLRLVPWSVRSRARQRGELRVARQRCAALRRSMPSTRCAQAGPLGAAACLLRGAPCCVTPVHGLGLVLRLVLRLFVLVFAHADARARQAVQRRAAEGRLKQIPGFECQCRFSCFPNIPFVLSYVISFVSSLPRAKQNPCVSAVFLFPIFPSFFPWLFPLAPASLARP